MHINFERTLDQYDLPGRFYHDYSHIERMFALADSLDLTLSDSQNLAILFHDVIYSTGNKSNEESSVNIMQQYCLAQTEEDELALLEAADIIMTTKHHVSDNPIIGTVLDLDLAELGAD